MRGIIWTDGGQVITKMNGQAGGQSNQAKVSDMKSKIVAVLIASFPLVVFAEVPLAAKTWVNPLFKVYPPVGEGPFVELKDYSIKTPHGLPKKSFSIYQNV